ncbi:hypothetical protein ANN_26208 [Periplaneta americana]|uniref:Uncharacterized protein n=1 Tax=Periplaneta americana TaxID=6978 RepID=A0ABQ8S5M8_PERAM|nr:hypothetical protein ANN_26208 [Periplaneta americana]
MSLDRTEVPSRHRVLSSTGLRSSFCSAQKRAKTALLLQRCEQKQVEEIGMRRTWFRERYCDDTPLAGPRQIQIERSLTPVSKRVGVVGRKREKSTASHNVLIDNSHSQATLLWLEATPHDFQRLELYFYFNGCHFSQMVISCAWYRIKIKLITRISQLPSCDADNVSTIFSCKLAFGIDFLGLLVKEDRTSSVFSSETLFLACSTTSFLFASTLHPSDATEICHVRDALTNWYTSSQTTRPPAHPEFQKQWDVIFSQNILDKLLSSFKSEQDIARLLALQESDSGAWLHALPSPHIGTQIDSTSFKIAMALRLGCKLYQPHQCICGGISNIYGHHALSCARSKGRIPRHTSLNDIIKRSLTSCGIPSLLEPPGISRADGKRPDGLTLIPWSRGKSLIWDSTCVDTPTPSHLPNTSRRAASAAELAVKKKSINMLIF